jgi:hypothetical protein
MRGIEVIDLELRLLPAVFRTQRMSPPRGVPGGGNHKTRPERDPAFNRRVRVQIQPTLAGFLKPGHRQ